MVQSIQIYYHFSFFWCCFACSTPVNGVIKTRKLKAFNCNFIQRLTGTLKFNCLMERRKDPKKLPLKLIYIYACLMVDPGYKRIFLSPHYFLSKTALIKSRRFKAF